jgi:hypothetical protein
MFYHYVNVLALLAEPHLQPVFKARFPAGFKWNAKDIMRACGSADAMA